jgi:hypothetical protein
MSTDNLTDILRGMYVCRRTWTAWDAGTMGPDDFVRADLDDDAVAEVNNLLNTGISIAAKWEDAANVWRAFAIDVARELGEPDDVGIEDLRDLAEAVRDALATRDRRDHDADVLRHALADSNVRSEAAEVEAAALRARAEAAEAALATARAEGRRLGPRGGQPATRKGKPRPLQRAWGLHTKRR